MEQLDYDEATGSNYNPVYVTITAHHRSANDGKANLVAYIVGKRTSSGGTQPLVGSGTIRYSDRDNPTDDPFLTVGAETVTFTLLRAKNAILPAGGLAYDLTVALDGTNLRTSLTLGDGGGIIHGVTRGLWFAYDKSLGEPLASYAVTFSGVRIPN